MTIQTISLKEIQTSSVNPRKSFNTKTIEGLAQSIKTDGVLQNLVVAKPKGKKKKYTLISGERRFRALQLLLEQGTISNDFEVPVEIKNGLSKEDTLRIATMENMQRENMPPLDEAQALATLVQDGEKLDDIVAMTGLTASTIRRRLILLNLSEEVKTALSEGKITLSQSEALTVANHDEQNDLLEDVIGGHYDTPNEIKDRLIGELPSLSMAIFPKETYKGDFTEDLFGEDETTFFNDIEQFFVLQKKAVTELVSTYAEKCAWAELVEGYYHNWEYREANEDEEGGVIVCLKHNGAVEIHEGLMMTKADKATSDALKTEPRPTYGKPLCEYMALHKSAAVQATLLKNPRKAKEISVVEMLYHADNHNCLSYLAEQENPQQAFSLMEKEAGALLKIMGDDSECEEGRQCSRLSYYARQKETAYDFVQNLNDDELERLFTFLVIKRFGQEHCLELDTKESSFFNRVAQDLSVDMKEHWIPDTFFLNKRNKAQLWTIAKESKASERIGCPSQYKKPELVRALSKYFQRVRTVVPKDLSGHDMTGREWLPEAMQFPAIDPDKKQEKSKES